mgnify:CR=1 FL=1
MTVHDIMKTKNTTLPHRTHVSKRDTDVTEILRLIEEEGGRADWCKIHYAFSLLKNRYYKVMVSNIYFQAVCSEGGICTLRPNNSDKCTNFDFYDQGTWLTSLINEREIDWHYSWSLKHLIDLLFFSQISRIKFITSVVSLVVFLLVTAGLYIYATFQLGFSFQDLPYGAVVHTVSTILYALIVYNFIVMGYNYFQESVYAESILTQPYRVIEEKIKRETSNTQEENSVEYSK